MHAYPLTAPGDAESGYNTNAASFNPGESIVYSGYNTINLIAEDDLERHIDKIHDFKWEAIGLSVTNAASFNPGESAG